MIATDFTFGPKRQYAVVEILRSTEPASIKSGRGGATLGRGNVRALADGRVIEHADAEGGRQAAHYHVVDTSYGHQTLIDSLPQALLAGE